MADTRKVYIKSSYDTNTKWGYHSYNLSDLSYVTGTTLPTNTNYLTGNDDYLASVLSSGDEKLYLHNKDLNLDYTHAIAGGTIYDICTDGTYYYIARYITSNNFSIQKYNAAGSLITSITGITATTIRAMVYDNGYLYLYCGGNQGGTKYNQTLQKRSATDLSLTVSLDLTFDYYGYAIMVVGSYLYFVEDTSSTSPWTGKIHKKRISDLVSVKTISTSTYTFGSNYFMDYDDDYIYICLGGGSGKYKVIKFDYDLNEINSATFTGNTFTSIFVSGDYLYSIDTTVDKSIKKYRKSDLSYVTGSTSPPLIGDVSALYGLSTYYYYDSIFTTPDAPSGLTISNETDTTLDLDWVNNEIECNSGNYIQVLINDNWVTNGIVGSGDTSFTITGLTGNTTYPIRVGVLCDSELFFSDTVSGTTTTPSDLNAGTIATGQTICYNGNPAAFTSIADASGGVTGYTYQWQYSTDSGGTWTDLLGANSTTYDSGTLTATRWFRRRVIDSDSPASTGYSNTLEVTVYPALYAGTIATGQTIYSGQAPALLTSTANASGASGSYVYQWQYSTNGVSYSNIAGATSATYQPPALTETTYYRRRVYDTFCGIGGADYSNVVTITVLPVTNCIYAGGVTTNTVRKYVLNDLSYITQSPSYGGDVDILFIYGGYIYAGGGTTKTVNRYNLSDLSFVDSSPSYGGTIRQLIADENYLYVSGEYPTNKIRRYNLSDLSFVDESPTITGSSDLCGLAIVGDYIYVAGYMFNTIRKYNISDLSYAGVESPNYGSSIRTMITDGDYLYVGGETVQKIKRYRVSDLSFVDESPAHVGYVDSLVIVGNYIYAGSGNGYIRKYNLSDLSYTGIESPDFGWLLLDLVSNGNYIYGGGYNPHTIRKYNLSDLTYTTIESPSYGDAIVTLTTDILYAGMIGTAQSICFNTAPSGLTTIIYPHGGLSGYSYQWYSGTTTGATDIIVGATGNTYQPPSLTTDTWYRKEVISASQTGYTNTIKITIYEDLYAGIIGNAQSIPFNTAPAQLTFLTAPSGGGGALTYQWLSGTTTADDFIAGATGSTYQPPALTGDTYYRCLITDTVCSQTATTLTIVINVYGALKPPFCAGSYWTASGSTCGNSDGKITITDLDYFNFYDFTLTDIDGNSYTFNTTTGEATGLTSGYYFLTATVKPAYWYYYGRETCTFEWLEVEDSDTTMANTGVSVRNTICGGFGKQQGRIAYICTDSGANPVYTAKLYNKDTHDLVQTVTGNTIDLIIFVPLSAADYYCHITNSAGCSLLIGSTRVSGESLRSVAGIKRLWLTKWDASVEYDYWAQSDEDYYLASVDADFFNSIKIKRFIDSTLPDVWYSVNVQTKGITFQQKMNKTKQGFVFTDTLTLTIPEADNTKWKELVDILQHQYILIFLDNNGDYWCMGYRHGANVDGYKRENNEYILEFNAISESKILTNIDKQYVIDSIL